MLQETLITFPALKLETTSSKNSSFLLQSLNGINLDPTLWNSTSFVVLKNSILKFIRPSPRNVFNCNNYKGIKLITWLRVGISHLREHKSKRNFQVCLNWICSCGLDIEFTSHFLLHCPSFNNEQSTKLLELTKSSLSQTLLYGSTLFDKEKNTFILNATIEYILSTWGASYLVNLHRNH